jgi:HlyD family secretion protein
VKRRILALTGLTIGLTGLAACAFSLSGGNDVASSAVAVEAVRADMTFTVPAVGYLEATQASPIAVPRVPTGALKVKEVVEEASLVKEGDIVVVFDDKQLNIELDNHKASFRSTNREIDRNSTQATIEAGSIHVMRDVAELEFENAETFKIEDEQIYSRLEIIEDEVRAEEAGETILFADISLKLRGEYYDIEERILDVERTQVKGNMDRVETSLANLVLKTPIGGLVIYKKNWRGSSVQVGDTLWPGNLILSIVDPTSCLLNAFVLERDAAGLEEGAPAIIRVDARPDREFRGKVKSVAEITRPIEQGSPVKYAEVKIEFEDGDPELLLPGMKGEAWIEIGKVESAVVIPRSALRGEGEDTYVLVAGPEGTEKRAVKAGVGDQVRISILEGLDDGERVLLGGEDPPTGSPGDGNAEAPTATANAEL